MIQKIAKEFVVFMTPQSNQTTSAFQSNQSSLCRYLFTLGELAFTWHAVVPAPVVTLVQAIATDTLGSALAASAAVHLKEKVLLDQTPAGQTGVLNSIGRYQNERSRLQPTSTRQSQGSSGQAHPFSIPGQSVGRVLHHFDECVIQRFLSSFFL